MKTEPQSSPTPSSPASGANRAEGPARRPIESLTADAALERPSPILAGGRRWEMKPPTLATLILVSEQIALLPAVDAASENPAEEVLAKAKGCAGVARVAAIMLLGAGSLSPAPELSRKGFLARLRSRLRRRREPSPVDALARQILDRLSPRELHSLFIQALNRMELGDFFGLTTFLSGIRMTGSRKVETSATASGESSRG